MAVRKNFANVAVTAALLVLLSASSADARWLRVDRAKAAAVAQFGAAPACGTVFTLKEDLDARGSWWAGKSAFADRGSCAIRVDREWYETDGRRASRWSAFCALYVHEWGHLLGLDHSTDPTDIMYATPGTNKNMPDVCRGGPRRWARGLGSKP